MYKIYKIKCSYWWLKVTQNIANQIQKEIEIPFSLQQTNENHLFKRKLYPPPNKAKLSARQKHLLIKFR